MVIKEILDRKDSFQDVEFIHERREANEEAHHLDRAIASQDFGRHVWFINPPSGMGIPVNILLND
jgi:hypothetical protein